MDYCIADIIGNLLSGFIDYQITLSKIHKDTENFISEELQVNKPSGFVLKQNHLQNIIAKEFAIIITGQDFKTKFQVSN